MSAPDRAGGAAPDGAAPAPDGQGDGAPADRPARALGVFALVLTGVLGAGLGLGAAVGPVTPPGAPPAGDHTDPVGHADPAGPGHG